MIAGFFFVATCDCDCEANDRFHAVKMHLYYTVNNF